VVDQKIFYARGLSPQKALDVPLTNKRGALPRVEGAQLTRLPLSFQKIELLAEKFCKLHFNCHEAFILVIHVMLSVLVSSQVRLVFVINKSNRTQAPSNSLQVSTEKSL